MMGEAMKQHNQRHELHDQAEEVVEYWYEKAYDRLVENGHIPFIDELPEDSRYDSLIINFACELYELHIARTLE
jgi:hypothetical protein